MVDTELTIIEKKIKFYCRKNIMLHELYFRLRPDCKTFYTSLYDLEEIDCLYYITDVNVDSVLIPDKELLDLMILARKIRKHISSTF